MGRWTWEEERENFIGKSTLTSKDDKNIRESNITTPTPKI